MKNFWGRHIWIGLFISAALLIGVLAAGWNLVLVDNYYRMVELARQLSSHHIQTPQTPWLSLVFGTIGFLAALSIVVLIFTRLLQEMRLNQLQSEFLAAVTHELKTPIATIELTSSLLQESSASPEESARLWKAHDAELKRLREDVEALLEAARLQVARSTFRSASVAVEGWLEESIQRWQLALGPGARLVREGAKLPESIRFDQKTLDLITNNILDNARKFARGMPEIVVRTYRVPPRGLFRRARWKIEFQDSGWGFDTKDKKRIFDRFVRVKSSAPYSIPGTGLGLFLARSASDALGLKLSGRSDGHGKGATFVLELPENKRRQA